VVSLPNHRLRVVLSGAEGSRDGEQSKVSYEGWTPFAAWHWTLRHPVLATWQKPPARPQNGPEGPPAGRAAGPTPVVCGGALTSAGSACAAAL